MSSKASKVLKQTTEIIDSEVVEMIVSTKEPIPESNVGDIAEHKAEFASYDEAAKRIKELDSEIIGLMREKVRIQKEADKLHAKTAKEAKSKHKRKPSDPNRKPSGFETAVLIPEKFYDFVTYGLENSKFSEEKTTHLEELDLQPDSKISRSIVTSVAYNYIKNLNLYEETDKRFIKPDEQIKTLFSMEADEKIEFKNFQTYVSRLFPKKQKNDDVVLKDVEVDDDDVEVVDDDEQEDEEEEVVVPVKTKSKSKNVSASI